MIWIILASVLYVNIGVAFGAWAWAVAAFWFDGFFCRCVPRKGWRPWAMAVAAGAFWPIVCVVWLLTFVAEHLVGLARKLWRACR
jgi:hypothetical protein